MSYDPPDWPALMDLATASAYLALTSGSLLSLLHREQVQPVEIGARLRRWRRRDLDALVDRLPLRGTDRDDPTGAQLAGDLDAALARVERRPVRRGHDRIPTRSHEVREPRPAA